MGQAERRRYPLGKNLGLALLLTVAGFTNNDPGRQVEFLLPPLATKLLEPKSAQLMGNPMVQTLESNLAQTELLDLHPLEGQMFDLLNEQREPWNLRLLSIDSLLTEVARIRSEDMAVKNYFSHTSPDGSTYISLLSARGVRSGIVGEILGRNNAQDSDSPSLVFEAFLGSDTHQLHIFYPTYQWVGIGVAVGEGNMKYYTVILRGPFP